METIIESQNRRIKKYLESGRSITPLEALYQFGTMRLSARIYDLRQAGCNIPDPEMVEIISPSLLPGKNGKKIVARYSIKK